MNDKTILEQIDFKALFNKTIVLNPYYAYVEIWVEENDSVYFHYRQENEKAQDESDLIAKVKTTRANNDFLWDNFAVYAFDDQYQIIETGELISEENLIDTCIEDGDWQVCYDLLRKQVEEQIK